MATANRILHLGVFALVGIGFSIERKASSAIDLPKRSLLALEIIAGRETITDRNFLKEFRLGNKIGIKEPTLKRRADAALERLKKGGYIKKAQGAAAYEVTRKGKDTVQTIQEVTEKIIENMNLAEPDRTWLRNFYRVGHNTPVS